MRRKFRKSPGETLSRTKEGRYRRRKEGLLSKPGFFICIARPASLETLQPNGGSSNGG